MSAREPVIVPAAEPPRRAALGWIVPAALALAGAIWLSPLHARLGALLDDTFLSWTAREADLSRLLVIDIDDASLRRVESRLGSWPLRRDGYALLIDYLRDAGVALIAFDIVFADPREGDAAMRESIARATAAGTPVVLAASGSRDAPESDAAPPEPLARLELPPPASAPSVAWPGLNLPVPALATAAGAVGVMTMPLDVDGRLRRMPVLYRVGADRLPSLPVAAQLAHTHERLVWRAGERAFVLGGQRWPVDRNGLVTPALPANAGAVPTLSFARLARAALGAANDAAVRSLIKGRSVFIGSSALLGDGVLTPGGQISGTSILALAYAALGSGDLVAPATPLQQGLLLALAIVPALACWRRGRPEPLRDGGAALLGVALVAGCALAALAVWRLRLDVITPVAAIGAGFALSLAVHQRRILLANRRLLHERGVADAASQAKSRFVAHVSHEIRTPMNALLGVAELLAETELDPAQRRHVQVFRQAGATLSDLVNDLLDLSKIEAGRLELDAAPFSLRELLAEQVALLEGRAARQGLALRLQIDSDVPEGVLGDRKRFGQVIANLLGNALKFTQQGMVAVALGRDAEDRRRLHLRVEDSGIGIAADKLGSVFDAFTQADASVTRAFGGTGLGLAITKSIVELMGGEIRVESTPGRGSVFHVRVALPPAQLAPAPVAVPPAPAGEPVAREGAGVLRILLAEDQALNVHVLEAMLQGIGHRLEVAANGRVAVDLFSQARHDLILMDVEMPEMDGYTAAREIRRIERAEGRTPLPIIALSAHAFDSDAQQSLAAGCDSHLAKPVSRRELLECIERHRPAARRGATGPAAASPAGTEGEAGALQRLAAQAHALDASSALARLDGRLALYLRLLEESDIYLGAWPQRFEAALAAGDAGQAERCAHDLKGIAATIGAPALTAAARELEGALRAGKVPAQRARREAVQAAMAMVTLALAEVLRHDAAALH